LTRDWRGVEGTFLFQAPNNWTRDVRYELRGTAGSHPSPRQMNAIQNEEGYPTTLVKFILITFLY